MSILKVARMGHPVLRARAKPLTRPEVRSQAIQTLIDDMVATMREYHGVGLAAPQVHEGVRLFVAALDEPDEQDGDDQEGPGERREIPAVVIVNPELTPVGTTVVGGWEGCLSIPDIRGRVPRYKSIVVKGLNRHGDRLEIEANDFAARVIQHETDHLDGTLFFDRMTSFESLTFLEEYSRFWINERRD